MKSAIRYSALAAVLTVALSPGQAAASSTGPKETSAVPVVERTYPSVLPLTLEVSADKANELRTLRDFTITAQREGEAQTTIVIGPVNPFSSENTCVRPMPAGITGCLVNSDATIGTLRFNWEVPEAGTYRFTLSGKRGSSDLVQTIGSFDLEARD